MRKGREEHHGRHSFGFRFWAISNKKIFRPTITLRSCVSLPLSPFSDLHTKESSAYTPSDADDGDQQNPSRIYSALYACLAKVPKDKLKRVKRIAFSGQMHGVVFWKAKQAWTVHDNGEKEVHVTSSLLYFPYSFLVRIQNPKAFLDSSNCRNPTINA